MQGLCYLNCLTKYETKTKNYPIRTLHTLLEIRMLVFCIIQGVNLPAVPEAKMDPPKNSGRTIDKRSGENQKLGLAKDPLEAMPSP